VKNKNHINREKLVALAGGDLEHSEASEVSNHLCTCTECAADMANLNRFSEGLDKCWEAERLAALGIVHPTATELEAFWMGETDETRARIVEEHTAACAGCSQHVARMEEGLAALLSLDPLGGARWSASVTQKFAAGIEMIVESAHGAFTSATGMIRDVMTPQATNRLAATPAIAMGRKGSNGGHPFVWHDATFQTDEVSGEVNGSSDNLTARAIITVVIHKSGAYMAAPPIVDLLNPSGTTVATQAGLDMGDCYTANFANLDEGRYLVGIREPGG
jgi:anti-sigma factor RsiW